MAAPPVPVVPVGKLVADTWNLQNAATNAFSNIPPHDAQREWLRSSWAWPQLNDPGKAAKWQPVRILGGGGNGVVGQWAWVRGRRPKGVPKLIAIKQVEPSARSHQQLRQESRLLQKIAKTKTTHVLRILKTYHRAVGAGTMPNIFDPMPYGKTRNRIYNRDLEVGRIYLECGEVGDVFSAVYSQTKLRDKIGNGEFPPEEWLWNCFNCLVRAVSVLENGKEDPRLGVKRGWNRIIHFDMKSDNVIIGIRSTTTHKRLRGLKLSDFGLACEVPPVIDDDFWQKTRWRGTEGCQPPEQAYANQDISKFRSDLYDKSNIWGIGLIMHELTTGRAVNQRQLIRHTNTEPVAPGENPHTNFRTQGVELCRRDFFNDVAIDAPLPYSMPLINLLLCCLAWKSRYRPSLSQMMDIIEQNLPLHTAHAGPGKSPEELGDWKAWTLPPNMTTMTAHWAQNPVKIRINPGGIVPNQWGFVGGMPGNQTSVDSTPFRPAMGIAPEDVGVQPAWDDHPFRDTYFAPPPAPNP